MSTDDSDDIIIPVCTLTQAETVMGKLFFCAIQNSRDFAHLVLCAVLFFKKISLSYYITVCPGTMSAVRCLSAVGRPVGRAVPVGTAMLLEVCRAMLVVGRAMLVVGSAIQGVLPQSATCEGERTATCNKLLSFVVRWDADQNVNGRRRRGIGSTHERRGRQRTNGGGGPAAGAANTAVVTFVGRLPSKGRLHVRGRPAHISRDVRMLLFYS